VRLHALRGALFLHAGARVAALGRDGLSPKPAIEKAIPRGLGISSIFGAWPDSSFAELHPRAGAPDAKGGLFRVTERGLSRVRAVAEDESFLGAWYGEQGRVGAVVYKDVGESVATKIEILDGPKGAAPEVSRRNDGEPRIGVFDVSSFPSGHLFFFGVDRAEANKHLAAVERWEPGATRGTFERPPMPPGASGHLEHAAMGAGSPTQVWIAGMASLTPTTKEAPYLTRWDGARFHLVEMPAPSFSPYGAPQVAAAADGNLWIGWDDGEGRAEIIHRKPDGSFSRAALPAAPPALGAGPLRLMRLLELDGELWMLTMSKDDPSRFAVFRTRPGAGAVVLELDAMKP
jgi:hypothetical protein